MDASEKIVFELLKQDIGAAAVLSSATKIQGTELQQRIGELSVESLGYFAVPDQPLLLNPQSLDNLIGEPNSHTSVSVSQHFFNRAITLAGGTTEAQKKTSLPAEYWDYN